MLARIKFNRKFSDLFMRLILMIDVFHNSFDYDPHFIDILTSSSISMSIRPAIFRGNINPTTGMAARQPKNHLSE